MSEDNEGLSRKETLEDLFERDLLKLFDRYDLHPGRFSVTCSWWATEILEALGEPGYLRATL
jgi:hypothetical protein